MASAKERNSELLEQLHRAGSWTAEASNIMAELWEINSPIIHRTVHRLTGLSPTDEGFDDMTQQAYFGFAAAANTYNNSAGVEFSTYAANLVKWELSRYYERNGYTLRVPAFMRRRIRLCIKTVKAMEAETGHRVTTEAALKTMGLSDAKIRSTLTAFEKLRTISIDSPLTDDGDGFSLLETLSSVDDIADTAIGSIWHEELHTAIMGALSNLAADARGIIIRHYFSGVSIRQQAKESGLTAQALYNREKEAFKSIRAGKYGPVLAEFMPTSSSFERAQRLASQDKKALERLNLPENEKELLVL